MKDRMTSMDMATDADTEVRDLLGTGLIGARLIGAARAATAIHLGLMVAGEEQGCSPAGWTVVAEDVEVRS